MCRDSCPLARGLGSVPTVRELDPCPKAIDHMLALGLVLELGRVGFRVGAFDGINVDGIRVGLSVRE